MFILEFDWKEIYTIWEIFKLFFSTRVDEMKFVSLVNFKKLISRYICASFRGTKDLNKGATNWIKDYQENGIKNSRNSLFRRKWRDFRISKGRETKFLSQFSRRFSSRELSMARVSRFRSTLPHQERNSIDLPESFLSLLEPVYFLLLRLLLSCSSIKTGTKIPVPFLETTKRYPNKEKY